MLLDCYSEICRKWVERIMRKVYRIGKFRFFTYEEYVRALDDVKKIKYITDEVDMQDPDAVIRLYTLIRQKEIKFKTEIGEDYLLYLSDIVADNTRNLIYQTPNYVKSVPDDKTTKIRTIVGVICLTVAAISFALFARAEYSDYKAAKELKELQELRNGPSTEEGASDETNNAADNSAPVDITQAEIGDTGTDSRENADNNSGTVNTNQESQDDTQEEQQNEQENGQQEEQIKREDLTILPEYQGLYDQNPELMGWIRIEGTEIDYPVMQSVTSDEFYLTHDFNKNEDANGTLFISKDSDYINRDSNITIYGHNMKSGLMFGGLKHYLEDNYWNDHKNIEFDTLYEKGTYEIVAVCLAEVEYQDAKVFKYYQVTDIESKNDFQSYRSNIKKLSVFGGDVDIAYGDQILTLSTCNSYTEDGRLFLIAKKTG